MYINIYLFFLTPTECHKSFPETLAPDPEKSRSKKIRHDHPEKAMPCGIPFKHIFTIVLPEFVFVIE